MVNFHPLVSTMTRNSYPRSVCLVHASPHIIAPAGSQTPMPRSSPKGAPRQRGLPGDADERPARWLRPGEDQSAAPPGEVHGGQAGLVYLAENLYPNWKKIVRGRLTVSKRMNCE